MVALIIISGGGTLYAYSVLLGLCSCHITAHAQYYGRRCKICWKWFEASIDLMQPLQANELEAAPRWWANHPPGYREFTPAD